MDATRIQGALTATIDIGCGPPLQFTRWIASPAANVVRKSDEKRAVSFILAIIAQ